jgi:hypothetical protein
MTIIAAAEAITGLLIEISSIATFTQHFPLPSMLHKLHPA